MSDIHWKRFHQLVAVRSFGSLPAYFTKADREFHAKNGYVDAKGKVTSKALILLANMETPDPAWREAYCKGEYRAVPHPTTGRLVSTYVKGAPYIAPKLPQRDWGGDIREWHLVLSNDGETTYLVNTQYTTYSVTALETIDFGLCMFGMPPGIPHTPVVASKARKRRKVAA